MNGQPILLLQTVGRRSDQRRITRLRYLANGNDFLVVAARNRGRRPC